MSKHADTADVARLPDVFVQRARDLVEAYEHGLSEMDDVRPADVLIGMIARALEEAWTDGFESKED